MMKEYLNNVALNYCNLEEFLKANHNFKLDERCYRGNVRSDIKKTIDEAEENLTEKTQQVRANFVIGLKYYFLSEEKIIACGSAYRFELNNKNQSYVL